MFHNLSNIVSSILIITAIGLFFGYSKSEYSSPDIADANDFNELSIRALKLRETQFNDAFQKLREIEKVRSELLTKFNSVTKEEKDKLAKAIPGHIDTVRLIIDINTAAGKYGMTTENLRISSANQSGESADPGSGASGSQGLYSYVDFGFSVSGTYEDFLAFLSDLQDSLRIIDVRDIKIGTSDSSVTKGKAATERFKFDLQIRTYKLNGAN
jgi:Tfp pilus assembly protein PilO